jgi:hypothetical protein
VSREKGDVHGVTGDGVVVADRAREDLAVFTPTRMWEAVTPRMR